METSVPMTTAAATNLSVDMCFIQEFLSHEHFVVQTRVSYRNVFRFNSDNDSRNKKNIFDSDFDSDSKMDFYFDSDSEKF